MNIKDMTIEDLMKLLATVQAKEKEILTELRKRIYERR